MCYGFHIAFLHCRGTERKCTGSSMQWQQHIGGLCCQVELSSNYEAHLELTDLPGQGGQGQVGKKQFVEIHEIRQRTKKRDQFPAFKSASAFFVRKICTLKVLMHSYDEFTAHLARPVAPDTVPCLHGATCRPQLGLLAGARKQATPMAACCTPLQCNEYCRARAGSQPSHNCILL